MHGVIFPGNPTGSECKAKSRACASNRSPRNFSSECLTLAFFLFWIEAAFHFRSHVRWQWRAHGRRLLDFREDASDCRSNFLSPPPFAPLSTSLSPAISRSASSRRIRQPSHFGNEGARLAICESVCVFSFDSARRVSYLQRKKERKR